MSKERLGAVVVMGRAQWPGANQESGENNQGSSERQRLYSYTEELKIEAVGQVIGRGYKISDVAVRF